VETREQCEQLSALGLRLGQGYLFARPASAADLLAR
jgi:EAL domain-containing protein (putative c-di-GMP-specific phosphodiesterase class I)